MDVAFIGTKNGHTAPVRREFRKALKNGGKSPMEHGRPLGCGGLSADRTTTPSQNEGPAISFEFKLVIIGGRVSPDSGGSNLLCSLNILAPVQSAHRENQGVPPILIRFCQGAGEIAFPSRTDPFDLVLQIRVVAGGFKTAACRSVPRSFTGQTAVVARFGAPCRCAVF